MSFGRPPQNLSITPTPPERGSFPLDHDGECKSLMQSYMNCLKKQSGDNSKCRSEAKSYLSCRMDNDLMARDDWENLGFEEDKSTKQTQESNNT